MDLSVRLQQIVAIVGPILLFLVRALYIIGVECARALFPRAKKSLSGEIVLITGSAQGLGKQLAIKIARLGAKVVLWDINEAKLKETSEEISNQNGNVTWFVCDVTSESDVNAKALAVEQKVGPVTILINNAGIMQNVPFMKLNSDGIRQTFQVNLLSHFWTIRAFLPNMVKSNRGHIVGISSCAGLMGHVNQTDYSATKHGVLGLMEGLSEEMRLKNCDIKFTTICPMTVTTGMNQHPFTRYSWLMPIVSLETATKEALSAIRREEFIVTIPKRVFWSICFARFLPHRVLSEFMDFTDYCRNPNTEQTSSNHKQQ